MAKAIEKSDVMWRVKIITPEYHHDANTGWSYMYGNPIINGMVKVDEQVQYMGPFFTKSGMNRTIKYSAFKHDSQNGHWHRQKYPNSDRIDDIVIIEEVQLDWKEVTP